MHLRVQARLRGHRAQSDIALQPLTVNVNDDGGRDSQGTERPPQLPPQIQKALPGSKRHPVVQFCRRNCLRLIRLPLAAVAIPCSVSSLTRLRPFPQERNYKSYNDLYQPLKPAAIIYFSLVITWDILRMLHQMYPRAPGLHLECFLILEVIIGIVATVCLMLAPVLSRIADAFPEALIITVVVVVAITLVSAAIIGLSARLYPRKRRQRRDFLTGKPTLAFRPNGTLLAVYTNSDEQLRTMRFGSLFDVSIPRRSMANSSAAPSLNGSAVHDVGSTSQEG
ncbi:hypothetical protein MGG_14989 [Pyricularia oryzae 70-15]|uniref:Uncharacterized protein n=1 Tax=Pyricularia oryzae (strain 70-15 / ATCC MYA-4617 / FGSC 8958) TaxID=242507 RepID=G4NKT3_PYRO7|nr:uncharacterized protein MGG_14989 [Pyricularia oryzae 70-15]EHA45911.1 hypothetical protein MGG_14989 [Pyricularia oryzae 70-15]KAI7917634.1 hypothetical protein M0657_007964 [Pyricularia oryzae]KAI7918016.1 hypothetical protein M9X92_007086 [Pyricularia oryzae]